MPQGKRATSRWVLNGNVINAPKDWETAETLATFDREAVQASLSVDKFQFVNNEATQLLNFISAGMTGGVGITEGLPMKVELSNNNPLTPVSIFDGMIDFTDGLEIDDDNNRVTCKLRLRDELLSLEEKLGCISFGYLESLGEIVSSDYTDVQYIVQKKNNIIEIIVMAITIYLLTKEIIEDIVRVVKDI